MQGCTDEYLKTMIENKRQYIDSMDVHISVNAVKNMMEQSDVPADKQMLYASYNKQLISSMIKKRWIGMRYPSYALAQAAGMSYEAFEDYFFQICNLDYGKMAKAMESLANLMARTDKVRLVGSNTDLSFSIKGIPSIICAGEYNIPDGEIFTAPVKDSVNGHISFSCPSTYQGFKYENIYLEFKDGKIIKATSNDNKRINMLLDMDEGARYIGEFAIGVNPYITSPMNDILFDEKIAGSFHLTPGMCYEEASNGNNSKIHWDLVNIQTPEYGGGEIYFDDVLIRKDGRFVLDELNCLNPENLK